MVLKTPTAGQYVGILTSAIPHEDSYLLSSSEHDRPSIEHGSEVERRQKLTLTNLLHLFGLNTLQQTCHVARYGQQHNQ